MLAEPNGDRRSEINTPADGETNKRKHLENAEDTSEPKSKRGSGKKERKRGQNKVNIYLTNSSCIKTFAIIRIALCSKMSATRIFATH